jgi:hypothetical protein
VRERGIPAGVILGDVGFSIHLDDQGFRRTKEVDGEGFDRRLPAELVSASCRFERFRQSRFSGSVGSRRICLARSTSRQSLLTTPPPPPLP